MFGINTTVYDNPIACGLSAISQSMETGEEFMVYRKLCPNTARETFRSGKVSDKKNAELNGYFPCLPSGIKLVKMEDGMVLLV